MNISALCPRAIEEARLNFAEVRMMGRFLKNLILVLLRSLKSHEDVLKYPICLSSSTDEWQTFGLPWGSDLWGLRRFWNKATIVKWSEVSFSNTSFLMAYNDGKKMVS